MASSRFLCWLRSAWQRTRMPVGMCVRAPKAGAREERSRVLRLGAAGAGRDGHDGVERIALAGEQRPGFQFRDVLFGVSELVVELFQQIVALLSVAFFLRQMNVGIEI